MELSSALSSSPVYHELDEIGNVIGTHNGDSTVYGLTSYDPWGVPTIDSSTTSSAATTLKWKGLHWEDGSVVGGGGLYYMRARWYDPELGRFISEDPIGVEGGINQYAFGNNDPVNARDPSGLCSYYNRSNRLVDTDAGTIIHDITEGRSYRCKFPGPGLGWELLEGGTYRADDSGQIMTFDKWGSIQDSIMMNRKDRNPNNLGAQDMLAVMRDIARRTGNFEKGVNCVAAVGVSVARVEGPGWIVAKWGGRIGRWVGRTLGYSTEWIPNLDPRTRERCGEVRVF
jgi:RHS repeat-associated protein